VGLFLLVCSCYWVLRALERTASQDGADAEPNASTPPKGLTLAKALEQDLGLALESRKGPIKVMVVDRFDRIPEGN
jgi:uncharacterized protein (TIGR03435 family)